MAKDIKPITEIKQSGNDFVITSKTPGKTVTNSFTIGKEAEITTMDGKKLKVSFTSLSVASFNMFLMSYQSLVSRILLCFTLLVSVMYIVSFSCSQCIVNMEGGKMVCKTGKFCHIQELKGGEMIEVRSILPELTVLPQCIMILDMVIYTSLSPFRL